MSTIETRRAMFPVTAAHLDAIKAEKDANKVPMSYYTYKGECASAGETADSPAYNPYEVGTPAAKAWNYGYTNYRG